MSKRTIIILSVVGVAVLAALAYYFFSRPGVQPEQLPAGGGGGASSGGGARDIVAGIGAGLTQVATSIAGAADNGSEGGGE